MRMPCTLLTFVAAVCLCGSLRAGTTLPPLLTKVGFTQHLDAQLPLDATFVDEAGRTVALSDYFHGKPVIVVLAYYRCPMLCTLVLNGLVQGLMDVRFDIGREFEIVTVSIDPRETPEQATAKKQTYVERYRRPGASAGWHFLTGSQTSIDRLAEAIGFRYAYDTKRDEYAHAAGIVVATPEGRLSHYFYDIKFRSRDLRLALVEASAGKIGSPVDQILLFCFHYDPSEGKYGTTVMAAVRAGGVLTIVALAALVGLLWVRDHRRTIVASASASGEIVVSPEELL